MFSFAAGGKAFFVASRRLVGGRAAATSQSGDEAFHGFVDEGGKLGRGRLDGRIIGKVFVAGKG
jgi:hypothetical protein